MSKQNITLGNVNLNHSSMNITQTSANEGSARILSKEDFSKELERLIATLVTVSSNDTQLIDAITDLNDALTEVRKPKPQPSAIRRFLNNAAALLTDIKDIIAPAAASALGIKTLVDILPQIFK